MASYSAIKPEQAGYNIFSPTYAASLAQRSGDPVLDNLNQLALMLRANQEGGQYGDAIREANISQREGQAAVSKGELMQEYLKQIAPMAKEGVVSGVSFDPATGEMSVDPTLFSQSDTITQDAKTSDSYLKNTQGIKALADAGFAQTPEEIGGQITNPLSKYAEIVQPYVNPGDQASISNAVANNLSAKASMVRANREPTSSQLAKMSFIPSAFGGPGQATFRGTPQQVAAAQAAWEAQHPGGASPVPAAQSKYALGADGKWHRKDGTK